MRPGEKTDKQLSERNFDKLLGTFKNERFLNKRGLANDLPFFICPYVPQRESEAHKFRSMFAKDLARSGISVLNLDVYDVLISVLKKNGYLDMLLEKEGTISAPEFLEVLQDLTSLPETLSPAIAEHVASEKPQILFLSGLGTVFPIIRPHTFMSHIQSQIGDQLTVMFFPGVYNYTETEGATLDLFGRRQEERYYRAFNIFEYEV